MAVESPIGSRDEAESASGDGNVIPLLKRLRTLLAGGLPAALTAGGNLKAAILEALPTGANLIGNVKLVDTGGANAAGVDASNNVFVQIRTGGTNASVAASTQADGMGAAALATIALQRISNGGGTSANSWDIVRGITTDKTAQATAVASGSDLTVWTPAAGKKWRLRHLWVRAATAGRYEVRDGAGTVRAYIYLEANRWVEVVALQANGMLSNTANNALLVRNQSGGASDMDALAAGNEE